MQLFLADSTRPNTIDQHAFPARRHGSSVDPLNLDLRSRHDPSAANRGTFVEPLRRTVEADWDAPNAADRVHQARQLPMARMAIFGFVLTEEEQ